VKIYHSVSGSVPKAALGRDTGNPGRERRLLCRFGFRSRKDGSGTAVRSGSVAVSQSKTRKPSGAAMKLESVKKEIIQSRPRILGRAEQSMHLLTLRLNILPGPANWLLRLLLLSRSCGSVIFLPPWPCPTPAPLALPRPRLLPQFLSPERLHLLQVRKPQFSRNYRRPPLVKHLPDHLAQHLAPLSRLSANSRHLAEIRLQLIPVWEVLRGWRKRFTRFTGWWW
jgi:hypothetical protein